MTTRRDRAALRKYLARVKAAMKRAGEPAGHIAAVVADLEQQILETASREGRAVKDVIRGLDVPEAFAATHAEELPRHRRYGFWGLLLGITGVILGRFIATAGGPELEEIIGGPMTLLAILLAIGLGIAGWRARLGKASFVLGSLMLVLVILMSVMGA